MYPIVELVSTNGQPIALTASLTTWGPLEKTEEKHLLRTLPQKQLDTGS